METIILVSGSCKFCFLLERLLILKMTVKESPFDHCLLAMKLYGSKHRKCVRCTIFCYLKEIIVYYFFR
jgi:hypothetical protein